MDGPAPALVNADSPARTRYPDDPGASRSGHGGGVRFTLNGELRDLATHPAALLLDVLREECGLTGTKEGVAKASAVRAPC